MKWNLNKLELYRRDKTIVRIKTKYDINGSDFIVKDWSDDFLLLQAIDCVREDGFAVLPRTDIKSIEPAQHGEFISEALRLRKEKWKAIPKSHPIDLSNRKTIIQSALKTFRLVVVHKDKHDPDCAYIGRIATIYDVDLIWVEITPAAVMEEYYTYHKLSHITKISFGGQYEEALWIVHRNRRKLELKKKKL